MEEAHDKKRKRKKDHDEAHEGSLKKKKKKASNEAALEEEVATQAEVQDTAVESKKKHRKQKDKTKHDIGQEDHDGPTTNGDGDVAAPPTEAVEDTQKEHGGDKASKKMKKKAKKSLLDEDTSGNDVPKSESMPRKRMSREAESSTLLNAPSKEPKKSKSRTKSKKRDNLASLDPYKDESLSEQSRKALSYVVLQNEDPTSWKFNKARQNWLIRNFWSSNEVPDQYLSAVVQYLAKAQGGVRAALIKSCEDLIAAPAHETVPASLTSTETKGDDPTPSITPSIDTSAKLQRAQTLLAVLTAASD